MPHMEDYTLTDGERAIIKALDKLEKLWKKEGKRLTLYNGNSLRLNGVDASKEIDTFPGIIGDGGDGGDIF